MFDPRLAKLWDFICARSGVDLNENPQDKLPRRLRAVFFNDSTRSRHQVDFSDWKLESAMSADFFKPEHSETTHRIQFAPPPELRAPVGAKEPWAKP